MARKGGDGAGGFDPLTAIRDMTPSELAAFAQRFEMLKQTKRRKDTPESLQGTAKDSAVQRLALWALHYMRRPEFCAEVRGSWKSDPAEVKTYAAIGEIAGVSAERVRQIYTQLTDG